MVNIVEMNSRKFTELLWLDADLVSEPDKERYGIDVSSVKRLQDSIYKELMRMVS